LLTFFFFSSGHKVDPEKVCTVKKFSIYFKNKIEKSFLNSKLLRYLKTFKAKKRIENFFTVYSVSGAVVGGNFWPVGEYSSTIKIWQT
jgi:hypothetical protein